MYELIQLTEHDYYIECPAKIGLVRIDDSSVILIDSGSDKDAAKKVNRILEEQGWTLRAVFSTHSHADHIGGNRFLQDKTGCDVYANGIEAAYTNYPALEPAGLYGGLPFKELKNKFLMAKESKAQLLTEDVLPEGMKILQLPGHCFEMTGFLTKDGTAYIADCVSSADTLKKYGIGYLWDAEKYLQTLDYIQTLEAERYVPSHAPVTEDISELAELNRKAVEGVKAKIAELCSLPHTFEELLKELFDAYGMEMNLQQYALIGSTVRSYLSGMYTEGVLKFEFDGNEMLWTKAEEPEE